MKKRYVAGAAAMLISASTLLAACGNGSGSNGASNAGTTPSGGDAAKPAAKEVSLSLIFAGGDPTAKQAVSAIIDAFTASHPNIKLKVDPTSGGGSYVDYIKTKDAVGEFPDIVEMRNAPEFSAAGKLAELPKEVVDMLDNPPIVNGKNYTAPLKVQTPLGIIYSKKAFQQAGITSEPKTYAEFLEDCEKIKKLGMSPLVVGGGDVFHMGFLMNYFLVDQIYVQNQHWNADKTAGKVHFTDPNFVKAMKDYTDIFTKGYVDKGWLSTKDSQVTQVLVSGKAAMLYSGTWMFNTIQQADPNFQFGFFAIPNDKGETSVVGLPNNEGWSISAEAAKNPDKVAAFVEFIKFFYSKEQYAPFLKTMAAIPATKEKITYEASEPLQKALAIANDPKTKKALMWNQYWGDDLMPAGFRDWFYKTAQQWLSTGSPSIEDAMKQADQEWDKDVQATKK
jgi:raffinose/stachyose/melibiose transport system substrate-binding protein